MDELNNILELVKNYDSNNFKKIQQTNAIKHIEAIQ